MIKVEINGLEVEAELNESLLDVARREKAHIGYTCGGNGACQTCEVEVIDGMEALSEINETEKAWLTPDKQLDGHRLACQAVIIREDVPIFLTTRVQHLLNIFNKTFNEPGQDKVLTPNPDALKHLLAYVGKETVSHLVTTPAAVTNSLFRMFEGDYKPEMVYEALKAWREQAQDIKPDMDQLKDNIEKLAERKPEIPELGKMLEPIIDNSKPFLDQLNEAVTNFIEINKPGANRNIGQNQVHRIPIGKDDVNTQNTDN